MVNRKSSIVVSIIFFLALALPLTSGLDFDNVKDFKDVTFDGKQVYGNELLERYNPVEIKNIFGLGKTLFSGYLSQHDDVCGIECSSTIEIDLPEDGILINDIIFKTLQDDGNWIEQDVRSYQFTIGGENYNIGEEVPAGIYTLELNAEKKFSRTVDWVIETNGEWLESWATWGSWANQVYDEIDDSSINTSLWGTSITGIAGGGAYGETAGYLYANAGGVTGGGSTTTTVSSNSFNRSDAINITIGATLQETGTGGTHVARLNVFGNIIKELSDGSDTSTWTLFINGTDWDVYDDGVYDSTITPSSDVIQAYAYRSDGVGSGDWAYSRIYYVYYYGSDGLSYVALDSPVDDYISPTNNVEFECSAEVVGGANLTNISLWINSTGSWLLDETKNASNFPISDIVSYYSMDETTGAVKDELDLNNGTIDGTVTRGVTGKIDYGFSMGGTASNGFNIPDDTSINFNESEAFSFSIWINGTVGTLGASSEIFDKRTANDRYQCALVQSDNITCTIADGTNVLSITTAESYTGVWTHIVMTYNGNNNMSLYINGDIYDSDTSQTLSGVTTGAAALTVGYGVNGAFNGTLDEFGIWNRSLASTEVARLYSSGDGLGYMAVGDGGSVLFYKSISGTIDWTCQACDSDGDCGFASENRTISLDTDVPIINVTYPTHSVGYGHPGENTTLNWTVLDIGLESCWYNYNNTNTTVTCADNNASFILEKGSYTITFYANDSVANEANYTRSWAYKLFGNSETYNLTTYETVREGFKINITSDGTQSVAANLIYDGVSYAGTKIGNNSEMEFNRNIIISTVNIATAQNKSFYWNVTYGTEIIPISTTNQSVSRIALGLCNATLTVPYINFTFKDEETDASVNATIDTSTWTYYLGDGTVNKTLLYSTTSTNKSYGFCFMPSDETLASIVELQYSDGGYPQRRWSTSGSLTNTTTNQNLYMLASTDGTYSVYQVQNTVGSGLQGVEVKAERQFSSVWTLVEQGITDSSGGFTGWLNPDYDHRLTFTKLGYTTQQVTIRPSSSTYTIVMSSGDVSGATYNSSMEGLSWKVYPDLGRIILPNTTQIFLFNITANLSNIVNCKMEIINNDSVSLGTTIGCDSRGGNLSLSIPVGYNRSVRGVYSVDIGDGYFVLDADAYWVVMKTNIPPRGTLMAFFKYAKNLNEFGDDTNRQEYSRIVLFFLMLSIIMGVICYNTGWDFSTAGGAMGFMTFIILIASYGGFLTLSYTGVNGWMDQYVVALITSLFCGGYILNKFARET